MHTIETAVSGSDAAGPSGSPRRWLRATARAGLIAALLSASACGNGGDSSSVELDAAADESLSPPVTEPTTTVPTTTASAPTVPSTSEPEAEVTTTTEAFVMTPALAQEIEEAYLTASALLDAARADLGNLEAREAALAAWAGLEREFHTAVLSDIDRGGSNPYVIPGTAPVRVVESDPMILEDPPNTVTGVLSRAGEIGPAKSIAGFVVCESIPWFSVDVDGPEPAPGEVVTPEVVRYNAFAAVIEGQWKVFLLAQIMAEPLGGIVDGEPLVPVEDLAAPCASS